MYVNKFYSVIKDSNRRPALFFYKNRLSNLLIFLRGYLCALKSMDGNLDLSHFEQFEVWLATKSGFHENTMLATSLLKLGNQNEEEAFALFYYYWDEYNRDHPFEYSHVSVKPSDSLKGNEGDVRPTGSFT